MTTENQTAETDTLDKIVLLLVSLRARSKVAEVAVDKLGIPSAEVHTLISAAFEKIRQAADFSITEQAGEAIVQLRDLIERSLRVQDVKAALAARRELSKLQGLYPAGKRKHTAVDPKIIEAMKP